MSQSTAPAGDSGPEIVRAFVAAINARDTRALAELMSAEHVFVDSLGNRVTGRQHIAPGWAAYFRCVPDYSIRVDRLAADGETFLLCGEAEGTFAPDGALHAENHWRVPAAWRAVVRGGAVHEWQVYADNKRMHELLARSQR